MADLALRGIHKRFGKTEVLREIDLSIRNGEFVVFVGPSGCGKSTLLRIIAGLERQSEGTVHIGDRDVSALAPARRGIAMVFQSYALYPHLSVRGNISLGLKQARTPRDEIDRRVAMAAKMLALEPLLDRKPAQLSGGQRQRVAIGRAIVRNPDVFLFDEPLSNLDAALRSSVRHEIAALHKSIGNTMVYVTHDQVEAMTLADRIVVLAGGVIQQVGSPRELYEQPANAFVAGFIGSPKMNLLPARGDRPAPVDAAQAEYLWGTRPEHWQVVERAEPGDLHARVRLSEYLGGDSFCLLELAGGAELLIRHPPAREHRPGEALVLRATDAGHRFALDGGRGAIG